MNTWLVPANELTLEQLRAVELDHKKHRVIMGGPGSGKTIVLLHRARYLRDKMDLGNHNFHIFVYTNVLKEYIKSALYLLDLPPDNLSTLGAWCVSYYREKIGGRLPRKNKQIDFKEIEQRVLNYLKNKDGNQPIYEFIMVDEGQDMNAVAYEIFKLIAKHITVCMDNKQQLYEEGSSEKEVLNALEVASHSVYLLKGYRCSPYIVQLAAQLIEKEQDRVFYIRQARTSKIDIETPVLYYADSFDHEKERLIEILQTRQLNNEKIAILFPQRRQVYGYATGLREAGLEIEDMDSLDFSSGAPKILTYHSAKGLTFDTVLLPRIVQRSFYGIDDDEVINRQLFVAITRAMKWVYMSTLNGKEIASLEKITELASTGNITLQYTEDTSIPCDKKPEDNAGNAGTDTKQDTDYLDIF